MRVFVDAPLLIYLNATRTPEVRRAYEDFYLDLLSKHRAFSDALVLDEVIYVSKRKYNVPYDVTREFIESIVLPFVEILPIGAGEFEKASEILRSHRVRPSDALHLGAMAVNGITSIVSEDREFDGIEGVKRIWLEG